MPDYPDLSILGAVRRALIDRGMDAAKIDRFTTNTDFWEELGGPFLDVVERRIKNYVGPDASYPELPEGTYECPSCGFTTLDRGNYAKHGYGGGCLYRVASLPDVTRGPAGAYDPDDDSTKTPELGYGSAEPNYTVYIMVENDDSGEKTYWAADHWHSGEAALEAAQEMADAEFERTGVQPERLEA